MPAITCPECGAATRVSLETPTVVDCAACGTKGTPSEAITADLIAAQQALTAMDATRRQLGWAQHRLTTTSAGAGTLFAIVLLPFAGCGGAMFAVGRTGTAKDVGLTAFSLLPAVIMMAAGAVLFRNLTKATRQAQLACAAAPPSVPGGALGCHVCGADLPAIDLARSALSRCRFCEADNVVSADVMKNAAAHDAQKAEPVLEQVRRHGEALVLHQARAKQLLTKLALVAPLVGFMTAVVLGLASPTAAPVDDYVLVRTEKGLCVARVEERRSKPGKKLVFHQQSPAWLIAGISERHIAEAGVTFKATQLVGHRMRTTKEKGVVGSASRIAFLGIENVDLRQEDASIDPSSHKSRKSAPATAVCLDEDDGAGLAMIDLPPD